MLSAAFNAPGVGRPRSGSKQGKQVWLSASSKTKLNGPGKAARKPKASPAISSTRSNGPPSARGVRGGVLGWV